jgi:phosphatidylglycerol:prolipoprotein diacylglycerol transferase
MLHDINPIAFEVFGQKISWYWLFYPLSFIAIFYASRAYIKNKNYKIPQSNLIDFFTFLWISMILGGRLGYFLIYQPGALIEHPSLLLSIQLGGMSFHGAVLGIALYLYAYSKIKTLSAFVIFDIAILFCPIALFFGRIGNFINGELWGRPSDIIWAMIFPMADELSRHPSQIYQALAEGPILFGIVFLLKKDHIRGHNTVLFLMAYSVLRFITEFFREPDAHLGFVLQYLSYGQILSILLFSVSLYFYLRLPRTKHI